MKSRARILFFTLALGVMITGCKPKEERERADRIDGIKDAVEENFGEEISDEDAEDIASLMDELSGDYDETEAVTEEQGVKAKEYPADSRWASSSVKDRHIQIDDIFLTPGFPLADIMSEVEASDMNFSYEYNPEKLVAKNSSEDIQIMYQGVEWFTIQAYNPTDDIESLQDTVVVYIRPSDQAKPYIRVADGRTIEEITSMSYTDVLALKDSIYEEYEVDEDKDWDHNLTICFRPSLLNHPRELELLPNATSWSGYDITAIENYIYVIDPNENKVIDYDVKRNGVMPRLTSGTRITSVSQVGDKEEEFKQGLFEHTYQFDFEMDSAIRFGELVDTTDSGDEAVGFVYEAKKTDGSIVYGYFNTGGVELLEAGFFKYPIFPSEGKYNTLEEAEDALAQHQR